MNSEKTNPSAYIKAIRLFNTDDQQCDFETGHVPVRQHINAHYFFAQTDVSLQHSIHPAPRRQFVITLKGRLKFTVTNGNSFILEPGILLIAADTAGEGHNWELIEGTEWERIYIPLPEESEDHFIAD